MPTNQSSPWGGENLQTCSNAKSPNAASSVSTQAGAATKVPLSQTSLEVPRRKDQAKPLSSNVASSGFPLKQTTAAPPVLSAWESGDGNNTNTQSQFTAVPNGSPNHPQHLNGIQSSNQILVTGLKEAGSILTKTSAPFSIPKKVHQNGFNVQLNGTSGLAMSRHQAATSDALMGPEPLCHQDLFIRGQRSLQQTDKLMLEAADRSSSPSVPPLRLTVCEHQGVASGKEASSMDSTKVETRSTATATRSSHSAKLATKCSRTTKTASNNQLLIRGGPPAAVVVETTTGKPQTTASPGPKELAPESQCALGRTSSTCKKNSPPSASPFPNDHMPSVLSASVSATQEKLHAPLDAITDLASCPAGSLVGSVTTQISTIHLTQQGQPAPMSSSSEPPPSTMTEERLSGETQLSGPECVMQMDGAEEELPDELENVCSDDDDSDCASSSTGSIALLSGVDEPMSLGAEDNREEKPALVPSLFPHIPPTLYFSTANERVELLPVEQRRLLKWKMSTVTPNVVKHTIARSHFKATKKSHDWMGSWGHHMRSTCFKTLGEHQKLNHFPGTFQIGRKDRLWRNLSKMQVRFGKQEFSFFPRTFILPHDIKLLRKAWEDSGSRQKWIVKPPASARGIGIQVIHRWSQMPRRRPLLVQKYLHKPYLISGNKFDLRIYVYVTSFEPLRIYIFSDGLVRFASCKYSSSMKTLSNKFMHLTNYSVNKKNSEYQTNSDDKACQGHKWALKALWQYLSARGVNTTQIWEKIKDIVIKTVIASEPYVNSLLKMNVRTPYSCHELFGFDIMLDENLKPWLLEVNISPSLHSNTALDASIKGQMIRDLLNLAGFRIPQKEDATAPCSSPSSSSTSLCGGTREKAKPDLSVDEKVKRAFYLTQRYPDQDFFSSVLDVLTPDDVRVLAASEDELERLGEFERIFPSALSSRYLRFFESPRYLNILLDQWERKYWNNRQRGIRLLRSLCEKGIHLGTDDPAHMWSQCTYTSRFEHHRQVLVSPSRSRVVVSQQQQRSQQDNADDRDVASPSSLPVSPSPGSSVASSACASPQPGFSQSLLLQQFASL
ncbi:Tubulin polyglutamylase TTLL4 [Collichthys lucidus]|uniref:Tubulin polyglutamylase TTLL4 n=1 Tax=Collichthys lucidus TaxID=240159 RepID=A0A4U5U1U7_COLLU|nr:Tubulin polyglutamylase TTLL4 [Collichthys lucidus]